ncbi:hypothetical protein Tco_0365767 [Tanacetum coccineum]
MERGLVPSCCVIFDLEPLSLSFDFVFSSDIFKTFSLRSLPSCNLVSWHQHAYIVHHLESLLIISLDNLCLDNLDIEHVVMNSTMLECGSYAIDLSCMFRPKSISSFTSLIHIESRNSPTAVLFDVDTGRISIVTMNTKEHHSDILAKSQG